MTEDSHLLKYLIKFICSKHPEAVKTLLEEIERLKTNLREKQ